mmetsp:Transcript_76344/g.223875  ORF Transcript_76344/g.223875 Transcript_76344/m.223875 type:complete len:284 (+) Transcript_76344:796-1647(+)
MLHRIVAVGPLRQVQGMVADLPKQMLLAVALPGLRDALFEDAESVRVVSDRAKASRDLAQDRLRAGHAKADQRALDRVRPVRVAAELDDVLLQRGQEEFLLLTRAHQADQGLKCVRAPPVRGHGAEVPGGDVQHAQALRHGAGLEGGGAQVVAVHVAHDVWELRLDALEDVLDDTGVALEQPVLQKLAPRLRLRHLHDQRLRQVRCIARVLAVVPSCPLRPLPAGPSLSSSFPWAVQALLQGQHQPLTTHGSPSSAYPAAQGGALAGIGHRHPHAVACARKKG